MSDADRLASHPDDDRLMAYLAGELPPAEEPALQDHLVACPDCAERLLEMEPFAAATREAATRTTPAPPLDFAGRALLRKVQAEVGEGEAVATRRAPAWTALLAAGLALFALGLAVWGWGQRREASRLTAELAHLESPQGDVPILYLDATTRSEGSAGPDLPAAPAGGVVVLIVNPGGEPAFARYRIEVRSPTGATVAEVSGLSPNEYGSLRLGLPRRSLPAGAYRLRVLGLPEQGLPVPLAEHAFRVR